MSSACAGFDADSLATGQGASNGAFDSSDPLLSKNPSAGILNFESTTDEPNGTGSCGATLYEHADLALTAAHCLAWQNHPTSRILRFVDRGDDPRAKTYQPRFALHHPKYFLTPPTTGTNPFDISAIILNEPVADRPHARLASKPYRSFMSQTQPLGACLPGFGMVGYGATPHGLNVLRRFAPMCVDRLSTEQRLGVEVPFTFPAIALHGVRLWFGDSGSSLFVDNPNDSAKELLGVASFLDPNQTLPGERTFWVSLHAHQGFLEAAQKVRALCAIDTVSSAASLRSACGEIARHARERLSKGQVRLIDVALSDPYFELDEKKNSLQLAQVFYQGNGHPGTGADVVAVRYDLSNESVRIDSVPCKRVATKHVCGNMLRAYEQPGAKEIWGAPLEEASMMSDSRSGFFYLTQRFERQVLNVTPHDYPRYLEPAHAVSASAWGHQDMQAKTSHVVRNLSTEKATTCVDYYDHFDSGRLCNIEFKDGRLGPGLHTASFVHFVVSLGIEHQWPSLNDATRFLGVPIDSPKLVYDGAGYKVVQWFTRARLEWDPVTNQIAMGRIDLTSLLGQST